jgi:hypothetical protein
MKAVVVMLTVLLGALPAAAYDLPTSRSLGLGGTVVLSEARPSEMLKVPNGWMQPGQWAVETGYDRRFELSDLDQFFVAAAGRYRSISVAFGASQFGSADLYAEQTVSLVAAASRYRVTAGLGVSARRLQFGDGYDALTAHSFSVGLSYRTNRIEVGLSADDLLATRFYDPVEESRTAVSGYWEVAGHRSFSVMGRLTLSERYRPQLAIAQRISLSRRSFFFWGLSSEPTQFGAGIELPIGSTSISYAGSYHPVLGFSFTVSFAVGGGSGSVGKEKDSEFD